MNKNCTIKVALLLLYTCTPLIVLSGATIEPIIISFFAQAYTASENKKIDEELASFFSAPAEQLSYPYFFENARKAAIKTSHGQQAQRKI